MSMPCTDNPKLKSMLSDLREHPIHCTLAVQTDNKNRKPF